MKQLRTVVSQVKKPKSNDTIFASMNNDEKKVANC